MVRGVTRLAAIAAGSAIISVGCGTVGTALQGAGKFSNQLGIPIAGDVLISAGVAVDGIEAEAKSGYQSIKAAASGGE